MTDHADFSKHTDEELRDGIRKSDENLARISQEGSEEQLQAAREQHEAMEAELAKRQA
jgi:hypothetical protein